MKDYNDFPPLKYFTRVLKVCPKSALIYTQLWKNKSHHMSISIKKHHVRKDYLISPTVFRNLLAPLMYLNLLTYIEGDEVFQVNMLGITSE